MKNILLLIFISILFVSCTNNSWLQMKMNSAIVSKTEIKQLTSINPQNIEFPGGRGANHLVVYTPEFGGGTSTNEWGSEAIIENGIIISIGGNNSLIPPKGMVISGNENASVWINQNLEVGMEVKLNGTQITYTKTENTNIYHARAIFQKAQKRMQQKGGLKKYQKQFDNLENQCNKTFELFLVEKEKNNISSTKKYSEKLLTLARAYYYKTFPPKNNEFRGAWVRLADKTPDMLRATIKQMADAGINAILPETIYNGYAIYPNAHKLLPQLPQFQGWNPLEVMIDECKKYNIKVIPWCEMFFVGGEKSPLVEQKPQWVGEFRNGNRFAELEPGFHYLCPSRPEVHQFLIEVLDNLASVYPVDGIQLDYIRYSLSNPWEKGFCYCDFCKSKVQKNYGFDIKSISPANKTEWSEWNSYRENNITSFVSNVHKIFKQKYPEIQLSADVVPDSEQSLKKKFQNWKSWVDLNLLDGIYIMSYSPDNKIIEADTKLLMKNIQGTKTNPVVGLGPYLGFQPELLLQQIEIARNEGASGVCLFSFNALSQEQLEALKIGPFRNE